MTLADTADQYFTYESRLTSFQTAQQLSKRTSNANSNIPKTLKWPHQSPSAQELAKAGFFYNPTHANPDNVVCFLCHKSLDGWEEDDDPVAEHLKHSADCGWAIVAAVERQDGNFSGECPTSTRMIDARRATFADKWPHENKKGWKCKIKQMVDAGWKYTPTPEYDDTATCTYCSLALDGWEQADKPLDEHYKRSPDCPFFALSNEYNKQGSARKSKAKKDRGSKASRLSAQSTFTAASDVASLADLPADDDDSILTTATNATATPAAKKMDKRKRTTTGRSRKTKAKKSEAVEVPLPAEFKDNDPPSSTEPSRAKRVGRPSRKPSARKPSARKPSARVASRKEEKRVSDVNKAQPSKPRGRPPKIPREPLTIVSATPPQKQGKRSQSPQSSDIENQPPSSKPSTVKKSATPRATSTRVPLSAATPALSPSKLNVISSLKSSNPWTVVDLDAIFLKTPSDENAIEQGLLDDTISKVKNSELTSPEKKMTVEEWIVYNGQVAEENLRNECERMVGTFEREGTRAMAALEGVECTE
ncbi:hypothetical protein OIDMADRAFT_187821 [Oidiodendron maius Zn]|uniref:BIR-domain-containing protein n=1 Tax=Oidiodendron maius (strain Zn) TaxID=913774 RepID=A0A0C3I003_OIDMZ|nr:hypothetical protein OIDMADRAFT_187821 [Oidiodendron maius Zn]